MVKVVDETTLRRCVGSDRGALECVRESFAWLHEGRAMVPPVMHIQAAEHHGDVDVKAAYVRGLKRFAVKIASGFAGNVARGLPGGSGLMVVLAAETGFCEAVLLDNGYLTDLRTALAGAVAADLLARHDLDSVGIVGTGVQARFQLRALRLVRDFRRALVWGRSRDQAARYVQEMREQHDEAVIATDSLEELVRQSDLVVTATASRAPLVRAEWLRPGTHLTAVGADFPGKQELDGAVLERADALFCDHLGQCRRLGELQHWAAPRALHATELGAVIRGAAAGRRTDAEITVCDLTGVGVQDTAIAHRACEALAAQELAST